MGVKDSPTAISKDPTKPKCLPWHSYVMSERLEREWSLRDLEAVTEIPFPKLQKIESRTAPPSLAQAFRLADTFGVFPEDLFDKQTGIARTLREMEIS